MWKGDGTIKVATNIFMHGVSRYKKKYTFSGSRDAIEPLKYSFLLFFELRKHDFDLIDVSAFPYFPVFSAKLYSLFKRKPMMITWHEVWDDYWINMGLIGFFGRIVERITARLSKNNLCVSDLTAKRLKKLGCKRIEVIPNWIELEEIEKAKPTDEKFDIISIGRFMKHKNFDLLLKVCAILVVKFPKLKVLIIGDGPETLKLLHLRTALRLDKNVEMITFTKEHSQIYSYMKSSKMFVLLSELEGFSITAFEALACGLPVITLKAEKNALAEYIIDGKNGFTCDKNEVEIAQRIGEIMGSKQLQSVISGNNMQLAKEYDSKQAIIKFEKYLTGLR
jgi:glycosyltransferase involved in cell wall biosynthesis